MLVTVHVDPEGSPPWYAQLTYFRDAVNAETHSQTITSEGEVCGALRAWLAAVLGADEKSPPSG
jgi:hypothetical protein